MASTIIAMLSRHDHPFFTKAFWLTQVNQNILHDGSLFVKQVSSSERTPRVSLLLHGPSGSGKTALAATIAKSSDFPFIKLITPDNMVGFSDTQQVLAISKVFADSYKSPMSVIVLDNIERLLGKPYCSPWFVDWRHM